MDDKFWAAKITDAVKNRKYLQSNGIKSNKIYRIDDVTIAHKNTEEAVYNANFMAKLALKNGVHVPQIGSIIPLEQRIINELTPEDSNRWFMLSRLISGENSKYILEKLDRSDYKSEHDFMNAHRAGIEISRQLKAQIQKLLDLSIYPLGLLKDTAVRGGKLIFNKQETNLYLTGYMHWRPILRKSEADEMRAITKQQNIKYI